LQRLRQPRASTTTPTTNTTITSATTSADTECNSLGIDGSQHKEGYCKQGSKSFQVVNSTSTLKLKSLTAKLNGASSADSLSADEGTETATAHGRFVIFNITVSNRLDSAQSINLAGSNSSQISLLLGKRDYSDAFDAENGPDPQSCVDVTGIGGSEIQPGESATCDVVFDVPTSAVAQAAKTGNLDVLNFGDDFSGDSPTGTFGVIRTYFPPITINTS
jgi:hypothetical protein